MARALKENIRQFFPEKFSFISVKNRTSFLGFQKHTLRMSKLKMALISEEIAIAYLWFEFKEKNRQFLKLKENCDMLNNTSAVKGLLFV